MLNIKEFVKFHRIPNPLKQRLEEYFQVRGVEAVAIVVLWKTDMTNKTNRALQGTVCVTHFTNPSWQLAWSDTK